MAKTFGSSCDNELKFREHTGHAADSESESVSERKTPCFHETADLVIAVVCSVGALTTYLLTLYPHVPGGDSGELIAAAYQLGVGHPPGYPLFMIIEKIFISLLHVGPVAWRMNVGMALIGSGAVGVLYLAAVKVLPVGSRWEAVLSAGLFGLNPLVWQYSTHAEVFPLNNLLVSLLIYLTVRYFHTLSLTVAQWGAFIMGLGLTNQHTIIVFEVRPRRARTRPSARRNPHSPAHPLHSPSPPPGAPFKRE
jgi:hypothetical protein